MTWIKLDTRIRSHPKLDAISFRSRWVFVCSLCYAADYRTDGWIPRRALTHIVPDAKRPHTAAKQLVQAGLWEEVEGGWRIHDYGDYQRSSGDDGGGEGEASRGRASAGGRTAAGGRAGSRAAGTHTDAPSRRSRSRRREDPPDPPGGGRRRRDRLSYEGKLAEFCVTYFPGVNAGYIAHYASLMRGRGQEPTVEALRPFLEPYRQALL